MNTPTSTRKYSPRGETGIKTAIRNVKTFLTDLKEKCESYIRDNNLKVEIIETTPFPDFPLHFNDINQMTASLCGVCKAKVKIDTRVSDNKENRTGNITVGRKRVEFDSFNVSQVRRICNNFYARKEYPNLKKLLSACLDDPNFPKVKLETFRKWLNEKCGFKYKKVFGKPVYLERTDIVAQREKFLLNLRHFRNQGYKIFFQDEIWASPNQKRNNCWQIKLTDEEMQVFKKEFNGKCLSNVEGFTGGFLVKGGKGRVIINHIGSEDGFLEGARDVFISKTSAADYHENMNAKHWLEWFEKVVQLMPDKSCVVLDQAPYHKLRVEGTVMPKRHWRKPRIVDWFEYRQIPLPDHVTHFSQLTVASLLELSKKYPVEEVFVAEEIARNSGKDIRVFFLPVAHCELNPIELIWAFVKGRVSELNTIGGTKRVEALTIDCLNLVTAKLWKSCIKHAEEFEEEYWIRDKLIEKNIWEEPVSNPDLCFTVNCSSDEMESSQESDIELE